MKKSQLYTLVFIKRLNFILLGNKTRGIGKGLWNGFGGKVEPGENIVDAAHRELKEESNIDAKKLKHIGVIIYEVESDDVVSIIHVFTSWESTGKLKASEEMSPIRWFHFENLPFEQMWPDSPQWYSLMFRDKIFTLHVVYTNQGKLRSKMIQEYNDIRAAIKHVNIFLSL